MQRVLLIPLAADADDPTFGVAARALRDSGHEVVHGGAIGSAGQASAVASQEDVDLVLLIGEDDADALAEELSADDAPAVKVVRPGVSRAEVVEAVRR